MADLGAELYGDPKADGGTTDLGDALYGAPPANEPSTPITSFLSKAVAAPYNFATQWVPNELKAEITDMRSSALGKLAEGMARPGGGVAQLVTGGNQDVTNRINEARQQAESSLQPGETNIAGYVGEALSPTTLIPAGKVAGYTVAGSKLLGRVAQGAGIGGAAALTTPVQNTDNFDEEKSKQALGGMLVGGILPPAMEGAMKLGGAGYRAFIEPWLNPASIKGRFLLSKLGDKADEVINLLRGGDQTFVPGSAPTSGEAAIAANSTGLSSLQKEASQIPGNVADAYAARTDAQNAARVGALRTVGQDQPALDAAIADRSAVTSQMYEAARTGAQPVDVSHVVANIDDVLAQNPGNPALLTTLGQIKSGLMDAEGKVRTDPQEISSALDGIKAALANKDNAFIKGNLTQIKNDLADAIPGYNEAQAKFSEMSQPVNQMQIGQYLENKLVPALDEQGKQKAASFAQAIQDAPATIKRATGAPRFDTLIEALTPQQMNVVNSVQQDLARLQRMGTLAARTKGGIPLNQVGSESMQSGANNHLPGLLSRAYTIAKALFTRSEGVINKKLASEIAMEMLNPGQFGETLAKAKARQLINSTRADALMKYRLAPSVAAGQAVANIQ